MPGDTKAEAVSPRGARFGLLIGIFVAGAFVATNFTVLNIGPKLALEMAPASLLEWTLVGSVLGLVYKPLTRARNL